MAKSSLQQLNRTSVLFAMMLLIVPAVNGQLSSCGFGNIVHSELNAKTMKPRSAQIVSELGARQENILNATLVYMKKQSYTMQKFFTQWHESHKLEWINMSCSFQDQADISCSSYTARVQQLFVAFNRIVHYLARIESAQSFNRKVLGNSTKLAIQIRTAIKTSLNSVLCSMYQYLALVDRNLHIESPNEIETLLSTSKKNLKEEIVSGLLYVYLTKAFEQFLYYSQLFDNSVLNLPISEDNCQSPKKE